MISHSRTGYPDLLTSTGLTYSPVDTDRNDAAGVEGDAVEGVLAELAESEGGGAVDTALLAHHVAHQRSHGAESAELVAIVAPAAAVGDGGR